MTHTFASLGMPEGLTELLEELGYITPFEVQSITIPDALAGLDIAARAPTGSGKTLAFGLPLLLHVEGAKPRRPQGLVLAPTRELADQIQRELDPIARAGGRRITAIYGGVGYGPQKRALKAGVDVLVACPGRLTDLITQGDVELDEIEVVVIDEADRMADMGFLPEVRRLLDRTPNGRQTLLFSATLDGDVNVFVHDYQQNPIRHEVGSPEPNIEDMRHLFWRLEPSSRVEVASNLIQAVGPTIVFCRTRRGVDRITRQLQRTGATAAAIHGSRSQGQRNRALKSFADGNVEALVATDVAARGIHVDGVACVLHFDPPADDKAYVHRSGRTARAGAQGIVVSFVNNTQLRDANMLVQNLRLRADLNTPAPTSLQSAIERIQADPATSFADANFVRGNSSGISNPGSPTKSRTGKRRRSRNGSRANSNRKRSSHLHNGRSQRTPAQSNHSHSNSSGRSNSRKPSSSRNSIRPSAKSRESN